MDRLPVGIGGDAIAEAGDVTQGASQVCRVMRQSEDGMRRITWPRFAFQYAVIPGRTESIAAC